MGPSSLLKYFYFVPCFCFWGFLTVWVPQSLALLDITATTSTLVYSSIWGIYSSLAGSKDSQPSRQSHESSSQVSGKACTYPPKMEVGGSTELLGVLTSS
ncbi:hypothetical protein I79_013954 [Cricetulus griseus]|uniref:Uncharacterized protein n=1 Tax=Cricetulus griseus TaxID=10029 RepID=G3HSV6_CRIGR|nr:hypothetical protein I79_013954 [Cricetulus griseus]